MSRALTDALTADFSWNSEDLFGNSDIDRSMLLGMKSDQTWKPLGPLAKRIAARLTALHEGKILTGDERGAAIGTYAPTAAGERGQPRGRGRDRAARNEETARDTPAPRQPVRRTEVEPHAGAVGLTGTCC